MSWNIYIRSKPELIALPGAAICKEHGACGSWVKPCVMRRPSLCGRHGRLHQTKTIWSGSAQDNTEVELDLLSRVFGAKFIELRAFGFPLINRVEDRTVYVFIAA